MPTELLRQKTQAAPKTPKTPTPQNSSSHRLSSDQRKHLGAFYTPSELTDFATHFALQHPKARVLDPGCGDAAFLVSAAHRLRRLGAKGEMASAQIAGVDLNEDAVQTAAQELGSQGIEKASLHQGNFFQISTGSHSMLAEMDALIGNPPYVRYQRFRDENRELGLKAALRAGVLLPQLSSSWAPYIVHASTFLKAGGRFALVLPGELLHVGYAAAVREFLLRNFSELAIITFEQKVFPGALEEVVLLLGTKTPGEGDGQLNVCRLHSLSDLEPGPEAVLSEGRICTPPKGERWSSALLEEDSMSQVKSALTRAGFGSLGDLGRVDIGAVTGANEFFVLTRAAATEHKLPGQVLLPVISKAAHVQGAAFGEADFRERVRAGEAMYLLFAGEREALASEYVRAYLQKGVELGLPDRYKCRTRKPWYTVPYVRRPDLFLTYMSHVAPRLVVNEAKATNTNTIHGVFLQDPKLAKPLAAAFLNSATLLSAEIEGRSYGGGVLKLEPREALKLKLPRLDSTLIEKLNALLPEIDRLVRDQKIEQASQKIDSIVLSALLSPAEIKEIHASLNSLRERRMIRGRSVVKARSGPSATLSEPAPGLARGPRKAR